MQSGPHLLFRLSTFEALCLIPSIKNYFLHLLLRIPSRNRGSLPLSLDCKPSSVTPPSSRTNLPHMPAFSRAEALSFLHSDDLLNVFPYDSPQSLFFLHSPTFQSPSTLMSPGSLSPALKPVLQYTSVFAATCSMCHLIVRHVPQIIAQNIITHLVTFNSTKPQWNL